MYSNPSPLREFSLQQASQNANNLIKPDLNKANWIQHKQLYISYFKIFSWQIFFLNWMQSTSIYFNIIKCIDPKRKSTCTLRCVRRHRREFNLLYAAFVLFFADMVLTQYAGIVVHWGVIHKPRGQNFGYFWPPFVVTCTK